MDKIALIQWPTTQKYKGSIAIQKHIDESHKYIAEREEYICCLHEVHELPKLFTMFEAQAVIESVKEEGQHDWEGTLRDLCGLIMLYALTCVTFEPVLFVNKCLVVAHDSVKVQYRII